jgi:hypothetical protein
MTDFVGVSRGDALGAGYYRLVFARNRAVTDASWLAELRRVAERIAATKVATVVSPLAAGANDSTAAVVVRVQRDATGRTVADLENAVAKLTDSFGRDSVELRSIERTEGKDAIDRRQAAAANEARAQGAAAALNKERSQDTLGTLLGRLSNLGTLAYVLIALLLVGAAVLIGSKAYAASKVVRT